MHSYIIKVYYDEAKKIVNTSIDDPRKANQTRIQIIHYRGKKQIK